MHSKEERDRHLTQEQRDRAAKNAEAIWEGATKELGYTGEMKKAYIRGFVHAEQFNLKLVESKDEAINNMVGEIVRLSRMLATVDAGLTELGEHMDAPENVCEAFKALEESVHTFYEELVEEYPEGDPFTEDLEKVRNGVTETFRRTLDGEESSYGTD